MRGGEDRALTRSGAGRNEVLRGGAGAQGKNHFNDEQPTVHPVPQNPSDHEARRRPFCRGGAGEVPLALIESSAPTIGSHEGESRIAGVAPSLCRAIFCVVLGALCAADSGLGLSGRALQLRLHVNVGDIAVGVYFTKRLEAETGIKSLGVGLSR